MIYIITMVFSTDIRLYTSDALADVDTIVSLVLK